MTKRPKIITFGLKADADSQDAVLEALDNREEIIETNHIVPPYRKSVPQTDWLPGIFKPEARMPQHPMELEDYGRLESTFDCESRVLPEDLRGGIYFDVRMMPEHADQMALALSDVFGTACLRVEPFDRGNAHSVKSFGAIKTTSDDIRALLQTVKTPIEYNPSLRVPGQRVITKIEIGEKQSPITTPEQGYYVDLDIKFDYHSSTETAGPFPANREDLLAEFLNVLEGMKTAHSNAADSYNGVPNYCVWFGNRKNPKPKLDDETWERLVRPGLAEYKPLPQITDYRVYYHDGWNTEPYAVNLTIKNPEGEIDS